MKEVQHQNLFKADSDAAFSLLHHGQPYKFIHFPRLPFILVVEDLAVHGGVEIGDIEDTGLPLCGAFHNGEAWKEGETLVLLDHFNDKFGIADLQKWGQQYILRCQIAVKCAPVIGILLRQEEGLMKQLLQFNPFLSG